MKKKNVSHFVLRCEADRGAKVHHYSDHYLIKTLPERSESIANFHSKSSINTKIIRKKMDHHKFNSTNSYMFFHLYH